MSCNPAGSQRNGNRQDESSFIVLRGPRRLCLRARSAHSKAGVTDDQKQNLLGLEATRPKRPDERRAPLP